jgi:hypothetical protein
VEFINAMPCVLTFWSCCWVVVVRWWRRCAFLRKPRTWRRVIFIQLSNVSDPLALAFPSCFYFILGLDVSFEFSPDAVTDNSQQHLSDVLGDRRLKRVQGRLLPRILRHS